MEKTKVNSIIDTKISEHKHEITMSMNLMDKYRLDMSTVKTDLSNKNEALIKDTVKLGVLKDKILFHKAAVAVLEDLKNTLTTE